MPARAVFAIAQLLAGSFLDPFRALVAFGLLLEEVLNCQRLFPSELLFVQQTSQTQCGEMPEAVGSIAFRFCGKRLWLLHHQFLPYRKGILSASGL